MSQAKQNHQSGPKHCKKSSDLRRRLKTVSDVDEVTLDGRLFIHAMHLRPYVRPEMCYEATVLRQHSTATFSNRYHCIHWRRFHFQFTRVHGALELSGWCAL